ncbi:MAG: hypothetical protein CEO40_314 [Parcubacteria group bacterium LiPW_72]|nr:MAG: hypothetical protein CEO40_314 [Parcubacteria group bacterium LiPW_72]
MIEEERRANLLRISIPKPLFCLYGDCHVAPRRLVAPRNDERESNDLSQGLVLTHTLSLWQLLRSSALGEEEGR